MQAIIMAGGRGTRLMPLTKDTPKPMVPIIDKPILEYSIDKLRETGITDVIITLCYMGEKIEKTFGDGKDSGVRIRYVYEKEPLGTAGGVKNASALIRDDFLVLSGDAYTDMDFTALLDFHKKNKGLCTMAAVRVTNPELFGNVFVNAKGLVTDFEEKPEKPKTNLVNTGIYVFDKKILKKIPYGFCDFSKNVFPRLLGKIYVFESDCFWSDIGTLPSYYMTNYQVSLKYAKNAPYTS